MLIAPHKLIVALLFVPLFIGGCRGCSSGVDSPGTLEHGSQPRLQSPRVDPDSRLSYQAWTTRFAFDLLAALEEEVEGDLIFSPLVVAEGLGRLYAAAPQAHATDMEEFYFLKAGDAVHHLFNELDIRLATHAQEARFHFDHRAAVVVDERLEVNHSFLNMLSHHYGDGIHRLDLRGDPQESGRAVQRWIDGHSGPLRGPRIEPVEGEDGADLIVATAASLQASWAFGFAPQETREHGFKPADGQEIEVSMMVGRESDRTFDDGRSRAAAMLFDGGNLSLIAIKPASQEQDFRTWRQGFDGDAFSTVLEGLGGLVDGEVLLPRLGTASSLDLTQALERIDFPALRQQKPVDLSGMLDSSTEEPVRLEKVLHGASLQIGERGVGQAPRRSSGSAADLPTGPSKGDQTMVIFDRPFLILIHDAGANAILMLGVVHTPREATNF